MLALKAIAALLSYPEPGLIEALPELRRAIASEKAIGRESRTRLAALMDGLAGADLYDVQEAYVELFDRGRATSLHLFEHVHGNARDRGPAMVDLRALYARHGLEMAAGELPDFLPAVLEYLSTRPAGEVREMLGDCAHVLRAIGERLAGAGSGYGAAFGALLAIAGEPPLDGKARPEPPAAPIDDEWADAPVIFGPGCADLQSKMQPKAQVVHFMNKPR